jgi:hypothetical protein
LPDAEGGGLSTIIEDQPNKSRDEESYHTNGSSETPMSEPLNNHLEQRNVSLRQRPLNLVPSSSILEVSEISKSQSITELDNLSSASNTKECHKEEKKNRRELYKRMASDTDLWMSIKSRSSKFQSSLEATKEVSDRISKTPSTLI